MSEALAYLLEHGEAVLFWVVLVEQSGLPIPAMPVLIAAGALVGTGKMGPLAALGLPLVASLGPDLAWYGLGRRYGGRVLGLLCRISLEPDSCVRKTESMFMRHGARSLLIAKFVPGLSTVTPPLAGIVGMRLWRFVFYDALGTLLWAGACVGVGWVFSDQLERMAAVLSDTGSLVGALLVGGLAAFIAFKFYHRHKFLRDLRMARISVDELKQKLDAGEPVVIVDVRHPLDVETNPHRLPGALHMPFEEIDLRHHEIPRDRDIVLYCACPNEVSSARTALRLKRNGVSRVRPLTGGLDAWREREFPLEAHPARPPHVLQTPAPSL
jgi:membrane protein DedA with SNARE-associated domain/rhodanese-related sulfurtransferase